MGMPSSKYGGIERFCVELASQLAIKGYHNIFIFESTPASKEFIRDMQAKGAELLAIPARGHAIYFCIEFIRLLLNHNVCLVHAHFTKARFYAVPLAHLFGVKKIFYTLHSEIEPLKQIKPLTRLWYRWVNRYSKIITVSDQVKTAASTNWPSADIQRIYLGIEPITGDRVAARQALRIEDRKTIILTIANFNHIKGLDIAVDAMVQLKQANPEETIELWIVGQPDKDTDELTECAEERSVLDSINMVGIRNDVPTFICATDIYIQPSRSEGLPIAIMEAMSHGLPIVASNVGGMPEAVKHNSEGLLVQPESSCELVDALMSLVRDKQKCNQLGENARLKQQKLFSIERNVQQLIHTYNLE